MRKYWFIVLILGTLACSSEAQFKLVPAFPKLSILQPLYLDHLQTSERKLCGNQKDGPRKIIYFNALKEPQRGSLSVIPQA